MQWPGWTDRDTLLLPLDEAPPRQPIELDGRTFEPKQELHVTLVGAGLGRELRAMFGEHLDAATRPAFEALDWHLDRTGPHLLIEKPGRTDAGERGTVASVIEMVDLPALRYFHHWLGGLLGRQLPVPPAHVTLYTHGRARGIGIPDRHKLRAWAVREVAAPASQ